MITGSIGTWITVGLPLAKAFYGQVEAMRHFQFRDVVQEGGIAGGEPHRALAAVGYGGADSVGQTGTEAAEVPVPDHVARFAL